MRWIGLADDLRSHGVWLEYALLFGDVEVLIGLHMLVLRPVLLLRNDSRRLDQIVS